MHDFVLELMNKFRIEKMKKRAAIVGTLMILALGIVITSCSQVSQRGATNFGVKQLFVSQAGLCNNKVLITNGKVDSSTNSDGYSMIDARTDALVRVAGDAIIVEATATQISTYVNAASLDQAQSSLNDLIQQDGTILPQPTSCSVEVVKSK
jgi:hypothetical protein